MPRRHMRSVATGTKLRCHVFDDYKRDISPLRLLISSLRYAFMLFDAAAPCHTSLQCRYRAYAGAMLDAALSDTAIAMRHAVASRHTPAVIRAALFMLSDAAA